MTRSQKKAMSSAVLVPCVAVLVAVPWSFHGLSREDDRHARFYNTGKTINGFLSSYCAALESAHVRGDASLLSALYASDYRSEGRGRWEWSAEDLVGEVSVLHRRAAGRADYGRQELADELRADLDEIAAIDRAVCKIDLIEEVDLDRGARLTVKLILDGVDFLEHPSGKFSIFSLRRIVNRPVTVVNASEECLHCVVVALSNRIKFVVVAASTPDR